MCRQWTLPSAQASRRGDEGDEGDEGGLNVFGDSAYANADTLDDLEEQGHTPLGQGAAHPQP